MLSGCLGWRTLVFNFSVELIGHFTIAQYPMLSVVNERGGWPHASAASRHDVLTQASGSVQVKLGMWRFTCVRAELTVGLCQDTVCMKVGRQSSSDICS